MKRVISILLALVMVLTTISVAAFAAPKQKKYHHVISLGDSISAGFGTSDYNRYNQFCIYNTRIEGAYPTIVSDTLGAEKFNNLSVAGFRAADLRYLLDENPKADWVLNNGSALFSGGMISKEMLDKNRDTWQKETKDADLIILDVGYNNIWLPTITCIYDIAADGRSSGKYDNLVAAIDEYGYMDVVINNAVSYLRAWVRHPAKWALFMAEWTSAVAKWMTDYTNDYRAVVKDIYRLNPNATIVMSGMYNPFHNWDIVSSLDDNGMEKALQPYIDTFNLVKKNEAKNYKGDALYVDFTGVEIITEHTMIPLYEKVMDHCIFNPHPTEAGQRDLAQRVLTALEDRS